MFFGCTLIVFGAMVTIATGAEPSNPIGQVVEISKLEFDTPKLKKQFVDFDAAARNSANSDFAFCDYQLGGNFVRAIWTRGIGFHEPGVLSGPFDSLEGFQRISVDASVFPFPKAKSVALRVESCLASPERWCVLFDFRDSTSQHPTPAGWYAYIYRWDATRYGQHTPFRPINEDADKISLPMRFHRICDSEVVVRSQRRTEDDLLHYFRSAESLRDAYLEDLALVEEQALGMIEQHQIWKEEPIKGRRGIPEPTEHRLLTPEETQVELAKAKEFFTVQADLVRNHYNEIYSAWRASFPMEMCWPELEIK